MVYLLLKNTFYICRYAAESVAKKLNSIDANDNGKPSKGDNVPANDAEKTEVKTEPSGNTFVNHKPSQLMIILG